MRRLSDQALQRFISASVATIQAEVIEAVSASQVRRAQTAGVDERARRDYERRVEEFKKDVADWSEHNCSELAFAARTAGLTVAVSAAVVTSAATGPFAGITIPPLVHILAWGATLTGDAVESFVCTETLRRRGKPMVTVLGWKSTLRCVGLALVTGGTIFLLGEALIWWILGEIEIFYSLIATVPLSYVFFHTSHDKARSQMRNLPGLVPGFSCHVLPEWFNTQRLESGRRAQEGGCRDTAAQFSEQCAFHVQGIS